MQHIQQPQEAHLRIHTATQQLQKEEEEVQRQMEMFAKRPRSSFQNLPNASTQSCGLLTRLMNPDPAIFPPNHPYRLGRSHGQSGEIGMPSPVKIPSDQAAAPALSAVEQPPCYQDAAPQQRWERQAVPPSPSEGLLSGREMDDTESGNEMEEKSVQLPGHRLQVVAASRQIEQTTDLEVPPQQEADEVPAWAVGPKEAQEASDVPLRESAQDPDGVLPRASEQRQEADQVPLCVSEQQQQQQAQANNELSQQPVQPAGPIHPYNLPIGAMPSTPRTTRCQTFRNELPESLRRQLLWARQQAGVPIKRTTRAGGSGPSQNNVSSGLAEPPSMVQLRLKGSTNQDQLKGQSERESSGKEAEEDMQRRGGRRWRGIGTGRIRIIRLGGDEVGV